MKLYIAVRKDRNRTPYLEESIKLHLNTVEEVMHYLVRGKYDSDGSRNFYFCEHTLSKSDAMCCIANAKVPMEILEFEVSIIPRKLIDEVEND
jgi:hypothetical protein